MDNNKNNGSFNYTYSAKERAELEAIRKKYIPREEDKMERLRYLDRNVTNKGTVASLIVGIIGILVMGIGMCCVMVWAEELFIAGIIIGIVGMAIAAAAYPVYNAIVRRERKKIAPEIIRLTDELMK